MQKSAKKLAGFRGISYLCRIFFGANLSPEGGKIMKKNLVKTAPEVDTLVFHRGDETARLVTIGTTTRSYESMESTLHRTLLAGIAHLEARGYHIDMEDWA